MNSLSITCFNRPDLLRQVIDSILINDTSGFTHCFCGIEPDMAEANNKELMRLQERFEVTCIFNKEKLGVRKNPFNLLTEVFSSMPGIDFNLYLEDDSLLSPDAFDFVRHYLLNYNQPNTLCCNLYNYNSNREYSDLIGTAPDFCALGMGLSYGQWKSWFEPYWFDEAIRIRNKIDMGGIGGWDWSIRAVMKEFNLKVIAPALSRCFHLGRRGCHCDDACYDRMFKNHPFSSSQHTEFKK